jgi:DNA repair exonuclease SbcCD ATPase subunit
MREQIEERLAALRQEFEAGRRMLAELEARQAELQQTLLRIGGAVQVLEELLGAEERADADTTPGDGAAHNGSVDGHVPAEAAPGRG